MKQMIFKRGISLLLAIMMCFTTIAVLCTTAFASAERGEAILIGYPRSGDANRSEITWGHDDLTFMNGWFSEAIRLHEVYSMNSYSGNICYCIEPGTKLEVGDIFEQKDETFFDNYPEYNHTITPNEIKHFFGRILHYGYTGAVSPNWMSQIPEEANIIAEVIATQILIWETVVGERDSNFAHVSTGGYNAVYDIIRSDHPLRNLIKQNYDRIVSSVQKHTVLPSFFTRSSGTAQNIELEWNGSQYISVLTDTNNVLSNYSYSASDPNVKCTVSGNRLTISSSVAPTETVSITATKNNSFRKGVLIWSDGNYAPGVGKQDTVTYGQEVEDPVKGYLNIKVSYGSAKIVKTSEDGKVEGISFTLTGNGISKTVQTGAGGTIQVDNLTPGVYTVTEQNYDKYEPQEVRRVTVVSGGTSAVTFSNTLKRGDVQVIKSSEDNFVEGVTFHLYGTSLSGITVDEYAVTDKNGVATFKNVLISGKTPYTLEELDTAIRYVIPDNQTAAIEWNKVTNKSFTNILKKWNVTVTKSDKETGTPQGDASLAGAVYGIYKGEQLIDRYTTDANGQFTTKYYVCANDWQLREIEPSEGYLLDESAHHIGAEAKNYTVEYNSTANDVTEQVIKGNIALIKHTDDGETQIETPEAGAEFEVFLKSAGGYNAAKDSERDYLTCNVNGYAQSKALPYGIYTIHQVKGWDGRELLPDFDVYIREDGQTYRCLANNANFESYIKIVKIDAETGKVIPCAGAGFQLYRPDGSLITQTFTYPTLTTIDTFYTNDNGYLITPEKLEYASGYSLVEVFAPYGYTLNSEPVYFDVMQDVSINEDGVTVIEVVKENTAQKGVIKISKSGEVFSSVTETDGLYQPVFSVQGLPGAVYEITAAEDIITPDGTTRYSKGEIVDTVTTDGTRLAESKPLYLGKFQIREIKAPYGMVLNTEIRTAELVYAGQEIEITETSASFYNERQKAAVSLDKVLEQNTQFGIGMNSEMSAITFGLFAAEDLTAADGSVIPADGLLEILSVDENGRAVCKTDLPFGSFYLKELSTDEHYILSDEKHPIVFDYAGQDTALVEIKANDGKPIDNDLIYGEIHGLKKDEEGNGLGGAVIGLFKADCTEFTRENAILTATSTEDGGFSFVGVPCRNWLVREIESPSGFVLSDETFAVTVDKDGAIIEVEIENALIRGTVQLTKVDKDYPDNKLTGAEFAVYRDSNNNKELDADDELLGTLTETSTGVYEMSDLIYSGYFVKEQKSPLGFYLDDNAYYFEIIEHGKTVTVENEAGKGFVNAAQVGSLKIIKTSSDGKVEGFSFRVTGPNGYSEIFTTNRNGEILIENLRIGEYVISEVSDGASAAYILPADKTASVFEGAVTKVEMHNELRDTPKTGDDSNPALWLSLLGISAVGASALGVIGWKKKKTEKEDR